MLLFHDLSQARNVNQFCVGEGPVGVDRACRSLSHYKAVVEFYDDYSENRACSETQLSEEIYETPYAQNIGKI